MCLTSLREDGVHGQCTKQCPLVNRQNEYKVDSFNPLYLDKVKKVPDSVCQKDVIGRI